MWLNRSKRFLVALYFRERGAIRVAKTSVQAVSQYYDCFPSLLFFVQCPQGKFQRLVKMRLAGAVGDLDCIGGFLAIGGEAGQRFDFFIELNNCNAILRRERIEKAQAREFQLLAKGDRGA